MKDFTADPGSFKNGSFHERQWGSGIGIYMGMGSSNSDENCHGLSENRPWKTQILCWLAVDLPL